MSFVPHDVEVFKDVKDIFKDNQSIEALTEGAGGIDYCFLLPSRTGGSDFR